MSGLKVSPTPRTAHTHDHRPPPTLALHAAAAGRETGGRAARAIPHTHTNRARDDSRAAVRRAADTADDARSPTPPKTHSCCRKWCGARDATCDGGDNEVLYPAIDFSAFRYDAAAPAAGSGGDGDSDAMVIVSLNRFERKKNIGLAIDALALARARGGAAAKRLRRARSPPRARAHGAVTPPSFGSAAAARARPRAHARGAVNPPSFGSVRPSASPF